MQLFDLRLMRGIIAIRLARKYIRKPLYRLFLPLAYLIGMDVKPYSDLRDGCLLLERFTRHLCLELCCIPFPLRLAHLGDSSFVHRIFYTLYDCPNSGDHLLLSVLPLIVLGWAMFIAVPAEAAKNTTGPRYEPPSWDQTLPANQRFVVLTNMNSEAVLDKETGLVWE